MEFIAQKVEKLTCTVDGKSYGIRMPRVKDQRKLTRLLKDVEDGSIEQIDLMITWLDELGLPEAVTDELMPADLVGLIEKLMEAGKKK